MSFAANIIGLHGAVSDLTARVNAMTAHDAGEKEVATDSIARFVEDKLAAQVDAKMEAELETRLDAKFEGLLDLKLAAALDAKIEQKLDTKVSVAVKRERAFLEQSIKDSLAKTFVDIIDTRIRTLRVELDAASKAAIAELAALLDTVRVEVASAGAAAPAPAPEPAFEAAPEPVSEPVPESEPESAPEPVTEPMTESESAPEPSVEAQPEPEAAAEQIDVVVGKPRRAKKASAKK